MKNHKEDKSENKDPKEEEKKSVEEEKKEKQPPKRDAVEELMEKMKKKDEELKEYKDKHLRLMAEFDNYRKWAQRDKFKIIDITRNDILSKLIEVKDNVDRAVMALQKNKPDANLLTGINMVLWQFDKFLLEEKITSFGEKGEHFDPDLHEAITTVEDEDTKQETISEVFMKGYKMENEILRFAKVKLTVPKQDKKDKKEA